MTYKPFYRWEIRRAARTRRDSHIGSISTHDLVMLIVILAMHVLVLRIIMMYGAVLGMEIGPFITHEAFREDIDAPYANITAVTESFQKLKFISSGLFIYWMAASWVSLTSRTVKLSTKLFKLIIGVTCLVLLVASFLPDHAVDLASIWFEPAFTPKMKIPVAL